MSGRTTKRCPSPLHVGDRELPFDQFHKCRNKPDGLHSWCKNCRRLEHLAKPHLQQARHKRWYAKEENRQAAIRRADAFYKKSIEGRPLRIPKTKVERRAYYKEWTSRNQDRVRVSRKKWSAKNPDYARVQHLIRRDADKGGNLTQAKYEARWAYYNGKCWMCGKPAREMDHIKPVSKGGKTWASNLRPSCRSCNPRKGATWPFPTSVLSSPWSSD